MFINNPFCVRKRYKKPFHTFWNANPSNWYRLSFSNFHYSVFLEPISAVHPALPAWRRTRATRSVGTWAWPDAPWPYGGLVAVRTRFFRFQAARTIRACRHDKREVWRSEWGNPFPNGRGSEPSPRGSCGYRRTAVAGHKRFRGRPLFWRQTPVPWRDDLLVSCTSSLPPSGGLREP